LICVDPEGQGFASVLTTVAMMMHATPLLTLTTLGLGQPAAIGGARVADMVIDGQVT